MDQEKKLPRFGEFSPAELENLSTAVCCFLRDCYLQGNIELYKQARLLHLEIIEAIMFVGDE